MKKYKILFTNKSYYYQDLNIALYFARRESLVGYRVSVFDGDKKLVTFQNGEKNCLNFSLKHLTNKKECVII